MEPKTPWYRWTPLFICILAGWIWLCLWLLSHSQPCEASTADSGWILRYVSCRPVNELGDFLAGVFAPLATVVLGIALFLQSRELMVTRKEYALNRELMSAQRDEAVKQAAYIGTQTELMQRGQRLREQEQVDDTFDKTLEAMQGLAASLREGPVLYLCDAMTIKNIGIPESPEIMELRLDHPQQLDNVQYVRLWKNSFTRWSATIAAGNFVLIRWGDKEKYQRFSQFGRELAASIKHMSPPHRVSATEIGVKALAGAISEFDMQLAKIDDKTELWEARDVRTPEMKMLILEFHKRAALDDLETDYYGQDPNNGQIVALQNEQVRASPEGAPAFNMSFQIKDEDVTGKTKRQIKAMVREIYEEKYNETVLRVKNLRP